MGSNLKQFVGEVKRAEAEAVAVQFVAFKRLVAMSTFRDIIARSPVWSGRYRGSHTLAVGSPDEKAALAPLGLPRWPRPVPKSKQVRAPILSEATRRLATLPPFAPVFISNNVPYANRIEHGHSEQAPNGVYALAVQNANSRFARVRL